MEICEVFDSVGCCKEIVRRNVRYLIELRAVRSLLEDILRYSIELRVVRSLLGEWMRYLIELGVVRSLLEKCEVLIELRVVSGLL